MMLMDAYGLSQNVRYEWMLNMVLFKMEFPLPTR